MATATATRGPAATTAAAGPDVMEFVGWPEGPGGVGNPLSDWLVSAADVARLRAERKRRLRGESHFAAQGGPVKLGGADFRELAATSLDAEMPSRRAPYRVRVVREECPATGRFTLTVTADPLDPAAAPSAAGAELAAEAGAARRELGELLRRHPEALARRRAAPAE